MRKRFRQQRWRPTKRRRPKVAGAPSRSGPASTGYRRKQARRKAYQPGNDQPHRITPLPVNSENQRVRSMRVASRGIPSASSSSSGGQWRHPGGQANEKPYILPQIGRLGGAARWCNGKLFDQRPQVIGLSRRMRGRVAQASKLSRRCCKSGTEAGSAR